jgi:hypothetical protein
MALNGKKLHIHGCVCLVGTVLLGDDDPTTPVRGDNQRGTSRCLQSAEYSLKSVDGYVVYSLGAVKTRVQGGTVTKLGHSKQELAIHTEQLMCI